MVLIILNLGVIGVPDEKNPGQEPVELERS